MKHVRTFTSILLLIAIASVSVILYQAEREKRRLKEDLIELSRVKYGLFNVDAWKHLLADIVTRKIEAFDLEGANREEMRRRISTFLYQFIQDFESQYHTEKSRSLFGLVQSGIASITGTFDQMKKEIPNITERILEFLNDPQNREAIRSYIIEKLNEYADETFAETDYTLHDQIIAQHEQGDREATISSLTTQIRELQIENKPFFIALFILVVLCGLWMFLIRKITIPESVVFVCICLVLLLSGLLLPMIEIDARITNMQFTLLGESLTFRDQVLYYKSKSILEVVRLMLAQGGLDLLLVGVLVFAFSVLFPISKLASSLFYIYFGGVRENKLIRFIVFRTGKWSMADVMVVAIFMAYIGFSGILEEQLAQIERITENIEILTTNQSCLLVGFYTFTSFAILSLLLSHKLQYALGKG